MRILLSAACLALSASMSAAQPLNTALTYQGELSSGSAPATGLHDLRFRLYDAAAGGSQVGPTLCSDNVAISDGRFTVELDFGGAYAGQQRFLEIEVRQDAGLNCFNTAGFVILGPRQALTITPHAAFALNAANASNAGVAANAAALNGQPGSFYQDATNITSGTLPSGRLSGSYSGAITLGNAANSFTGNGAGLTSLNATNLTSGTLLSARLSGSYTNVLDFNNFANTFTGDGSNLRSLNAAELAFGTLPDPRLAGTYGNALNFTNVSNAFTGSGAGLTSLNAANMTSGTLPSARLSGTYSNALNFNNPANTFSGSGAGLTALNASTLTAGTLPDARLSSNVALLAGAQTFSGSKTFSGGLATSAFSLTTNPIAGRVLQSDASGAGTWQPDGLALPYSGSVSAGVALAITATSTSDVAAFVINNTSSAAECVDAASNGTGNAIQSVMSGTGRAGSFTLSNTASTSDCIFATGSGSGNTLSATALGNGRAAELANTNAANANPALAVSAAGAPAGNSGALSCVTTNASSGRAAYFENSASGFYAIRVNNTTGALAAQFVGNVAVTGNLSASGTKPFCIDHPTDPANKVLYHYALESPEVLNMYRGTITLDETGSASPRLPAYFEALNRSFDYQLTPIGAPMPSLHIAAEIEDNSFQIAGGAPGMKVSWQVTAARNDAYVQKHGAPVEVEKSGINKGRYLQPELFGRPASDRVIEDPTR